MFLFLLSCAAPQKPPMVGSGEEGLRVCSTAEIAAYRDQLGEKRVSTPARASLEQLYEQAVASWATCMVLKEQSGWSIPPVLDPAALALLQAVQASPGSEIRAQGLWRAKGRLPEAVSLVALQDLEDAVVSASGSPVPFEQLSSVRPYACLGVPETETCDDAKGSRETAGLDLLRQLARPATNPINHLTVSFREPVRASWEAIESHPIPLGMSPPLPPEALAKGSGGALGNPMATPYLVVTRDKTFWLQGDSLVVTQDQVTLTRRPIEVMFPDTTTEGPYLWVARDVPVHKVVDLLSLHPGWASPMLVGANDQGDYVRLDTPLPHRGSQAPGVLVLHQESTMQDLMALSQQGLKLVLPPTP